METERNTIRCTCCGNAAVLDKTAALISTQGSEVPKSIHEWFNAQAEYEMQFLDENMEPMELQVNVRLPADAESEKVIEGSGSLCLDPTGWSYKGKLSGDDVALFFPIDSVPALPCDYDDNFQIYSDGKFYMFTPAEDMHKCIKYSVIGECAYKRFASNSQMIW